MCHGIGSWTVNASESIRVYSDSHSQSSSQPAIIQETGYQTGYFTLLISQERCSSPWLRPYAKDIIGKHGL